METWNPELEAIEMEFMEAYEAGQNPTLDDFARRHPRYARELTEFVMLFLEGEGAAARVTDAEIQALATPAPTSPVE